MNPRQFLITGLVLIAAILQQTAITQAQDTPSLSIAASGFVNPRGFAFDSAGQLTVAEAGVGGEVGQSDGPISIGSTGAIAVAQDRCATPLMTDLPSLRNTLGETWGPTAIATIGSRVFALISGGGEANGNPEVASGVYELVDGGLLLRADLGNWYTANPATTPPTESSITGGLWVAMTANSAGDSLLAVEQGAGQLVQVTLDGVVSRIADLSADNQAPSAVATGPNGSIYVGYFTAEPFASRAATVARIGSDGTREVVWTGLTQVTGLAIDAQGVLYAAEMSSSRDEPPFFVPGTGRIVRQTGPDSSTEVVTQLNLPGQIAFGLDAALYISMPMNGADSGTGLILRADVSGSAPLVAGEFDLAPTSCLAGSSTVVIIVDDLGINPSTVTVPVGATVTWRMGGEFDHAVASDPSSAINWDSGVLTPGQEFSVTFEQPGIFAYFDGLYPDHVGEIVVVAE